MIETSLSCKISFMLISLNTAINNYFTLIILTPSNTALSGPSGLFKSAVAYLSNSVYNILFISFSISDNWDPKCLE